MRIEKHVEIERPPEEVFTVIADPDNDPVWCPTVYESERIEGEGAAPGAVYRQVHKPGPAPPTELEVELLEIDPWHHLRLRSTDELGWFDVRYELEELPDGRTRLTQVDETHFQGFARLLQPILWLAINRGMRRQFERLKQLLETDGVPDPARE